MISDQVYNVLTNGVGHIGCASSSLKPFHADALGICCDQTRGTIVCCLNKETNKLFIENLEIGSRVSLFVGVISHEAYNLKGAVTDLRDVTNDEIQVCDDLRNKMYSFYDELGIPKNLADRYWLKPTDLAVVFSVDKVFVQTPGPDAGKEI